MKMLILRSALAAAAALVLTACASSETGNGQNPTVTVQLAMTASESDPSGALLLRDADGEAFTVTSAQAVIASIEFKLPDGVDCPTGTLEGGLVCEVSENTIKVEGPWLVDLLSGTWAPPLEMLSLLAGSYDQVSVRFDDNHTGLVPTNDPLHEASVVVAGTLTTGGTEQAYRMRLDFSEKAVFDGAAAVGADAQDKALKLTLDATSWFSGAPVTQCAEDGDFTMDGGTLVLGDSGGGGCSDLEDQVKDAIKTPGDLDAEESTPKS